MATAKHTIKSRSLTSLVKQDADLMKVLVKEAVQHLRGPQNLVHHLCKSGPRSSLPRQALKVPGGPRTPWRKTLFFLMTRLVPVVDS